MSQTFLRQLNSHEERLKRLRDWDYFHGREYDELTWKVDAKRKELGRSAPIVRFEMAFRKRFREYGIPVYCNEMTDTSAEMFHCQWLNRLSLGEQNILLTFGQEIAQGVRVRLGNEPASNYWWDVEPVGAEATFTVYPWRLPMREELNERCDDAAAGAQRIVVLQEELEDVQRRLRTEMDRLRLGRS